jgi:hypothetical protein
VLALVGVVAELYVEGCWHRQEALLDRSPIDPLATVERQVVGRGRDSLVTAEAIPSLSEGLCNG